MKLPVVPLDSLTDIQKAKDRAPGPTDGQYGTKYWTLGNPLLDLLYVPAVLAFLLGFPVLFGFVVHSCTT